MKNFVLWLKEMYRWIFRLPIRHYYWWAVVLVGVSFFAVGVSGWTEKAFRLAGMFLQLGGVFTVVWGILKTRAEFGQPTVMSQFKNWVKMFPPLHPLPITVTARAILPGLAGKGYGYSIHGPAADQTIEGRLTHLESIVKELEMAQGSAYIAARQVDEKAQQALDAQARQLSGQICAVETKIEATAVGGIHVSAVGVVWLLFGTIFGGAAPELQQLLTRW